jgi:hypothetical protein
MLLLSQINSPLTIRLCQTKSRFISTPAQTCEKKDGSHCYGGIGVPLNGNGIKSFEWKGWIVAGLAMEWRDGSLSTISLPFYSPRKCWKRYLYVN